MNLNASPDSVAYDSGQLKSLKAQFPLLYNRDNKTLQSGKLLRL